MELVHRYRQSTRLRGYDYASPGRYFVTILTYDRECLLGKIVDGQTKLSELGEIVQELWLEVPNHFPNVSLDAFVIMPNHVHGVLTISHRVRTRHAVSLPRTEQYGKPVPGSIPTIIRSFKSAATKRINEFRKTPGTPVWHNRYHDHIICDTKDLTRIRRYILENPVNWQKDEETRHHK